MTESLWLRVFAGPNGSGKSTIVNDLRKLKIDGWPLGFGTYVNADEIALRLTREHELPFEAYRVKATYRSLEAFAKSAGLVRREFSQATLRRHITVRKNVLALNRDARASRAVISYVAQLIAQYLCDRLLRAKRKFSLETVFSHASKLRLMRRAKRAGYKVYLYYVATEEPEICVQRVLMRAASGGHGVPAERVRARYFKSLENLFEGIELSYRAYFWDSSDERFQFLEQQKMTSGQVFTFKKRTPLWFKKYYIDKLPE